MRENILQKVVDVADADSHQVDRGGVAKQHLPREEHEWRSDVIIFSRTFQREEPLDTGGGRVFSLDVSFGLLATASTSAPALFLGSALCWCGVSWMIWRDKKKCMGEKEEVDMRPIPIRSNEGEFPSSACHEKNNAYA